MRVYNQCFAIIFFSLLFFSKYIFAKDVDIAPIEETYNGYCHFNGIFEDESRWEEEFKMLEEEHDHPNYIHMSGGLAFIMVMPDHYADKCPSLKKYLMELTKYHVGNDRVSKDTKMFLDYIVEHQLSDKNDSNILTAIFNWFGWKSRESDLTTVSTTIHKPISNDDSDAYEVLCDFHGLIYGDPESSECDDFKLLLKDKKESGHLIMASIVGRLAVTDREVLKSPSCAVSKYVHALMQYYDNHRTKIERKYKELAEALAFIKFKLNDYGNEEKVFGEIKNDEL